MKKLLLFVLTVCLLLCLAACTQPPAPDPVPAEPPVPEEEISENPASLWIEANGEIVKPYKQFLWDESYEEDGSGLCAEGAPASVDERDFTDSLPSVTYTDDFEIFLDEDVSSSGFTVYDMDQSEVLRESKFSNLTQLPAGEYIVEISIMVRGDYVEAADAYDSSGYECWFRLTMPA